MKPTLNTNTNGWKFPLVDYDYQSTTLEGFSGRCVKMPKSLNRIGGNYFDVEANRDFLSDAAVFGTLIATAMVPIVAGVSAVIQLCRALPL